jgi:diaminopimelate epimerase
MHGPDRDVVAVPLQLADGATLTATAVSVGNPHCVIFVDRLDEAEARRLGPLVERHPAFPQRTNVQFARVTGRDALDILIWERGAGYTLASGTSSCAVACAAAKTGLTDRRVTIESPGGQLTVAIADSWEITLQGPASEICRGRLSGDLLRNLAA